MLPLQSLCSHIVSSYRNGPFHIWFSDGEAMYRCSVGSGTYRVHIASVIAWFTSTGTFTTFPLIEYCAPHGNSRTCINGMRSDTSRSSNWYNCNSLGFCGKPMPLVIENLGALPCETQLLHVVQIHCLSSTDCKSVTQVFQTSMELQIVLAKFMKFGSYTRRFQASGA